MLVGSVPRGCGDAFYARLAAAATQRRIPVFIDAQGRQLITQ